MSLASSFTNFMKIIFFISLILIVYTYFIYPILIYLLSQLYKKPVRGKYIYPALSIIISAYNEERNIENKLKSLLEIDYPRERFEILIGSDGSIDKTDEIVKRFTAEKKGQSPLADKPIAMAGTVPVFPAEKKRIKFFRQETRQGKPNMLNLLAKEAKGEILVFTDARQRLDRDALKELVKHFSDEKVGSVSSALFYENENGNNKTGVGIGMYWKYEKFIRKSESRMGSMLGATGALYAIRKELFPQLPNDLLLDDVYIPMKIVERGYRAIFDKKAKVYDKVFANPKEEFLRRVRTLAGNYQLFFYLGSLFNPLKGKISWQFFSHKFLRLMVPFLLIALLVSNVMVIKIGTVPFGDSPYFYWIFLLLQIIFYVFALLGVLLKNKNKAFDIPRMFCLMNSAAVVGLYRLLTRRQDVLWYKVV